MAKKVLKKQRSEKTVYLEFKNSTPGNSNPGSTGIFNFINKFMPGLTDMMKIKIVTFLGLISMLIVSILSFNQRQYSLSAILFIIPVFILLLFFTNKGALGQGGRLFDFTIHKQSPIIVLLKLTLVVTAVFIGQYYFMKNDKAMGCIFFIAALFQLYFMLRLVPITGTNINADYNESIILKKNQGLAAWILSVVFILLSLFSAKADNAGASLVLLIFGTACMAFIPGFNRLRQDKDELNEGFDRTDLYIVIGIFVISLILRSFRLLDIPPGFNGDEGNAMEMYNCASKGGSFPMYIAGAANAASFPAILVGTIGKWIGMNIFTARLIHSVIGALNVVFIYLFARELFSRRVAVITAIFLMFMTQHLLFSRKIESMIFTMFFATACFSIYFTALRKGNKLLMILSGLCLGLGIYFYTPGRVTPVILVIFWLIILMRNIMKKETYRYLIFSMLLVAASLIAFTPLMDFVVKNPKIYFERAAAFNVLPSVLDGADMVTPVINQFKPYFDLFFLKGSPVAIYNISGVPAFDVIFNYFLLAGLGFLIFNWRNRGNLFVLLWFFVGMGIGLIASSSDLYPARMILALPVLAVIAAIGMDRQAGWIENIKLKNSKRVALSVMFIILLIFVILNVYSFFIRLPKDAAVRYYYNSYINEIGNYLKIKPDNNVFASMFYSVDVIGSQLKFFEGYYCKKIEYLDISLGELNRYYNKDGKDVIIIAEGIYYSAGDYFKKYFPKSEIHTGKDASYKVFEGVIDAKKEYGWIDADAIIRKLDELYLSGDKFKRAVPSVNFMAFTIPYDDIKELFRLNVDYIIKDNNVNVRLEENLIVPPKGTISAVINNIIEVPEYGIYQFAVDNCGDYTVNIDGKQISGSVKLSKGLHKIKILIENPYENGSVIKWKYGNKQFETIEIRYFINSREVSGLKAKYLDGAKEVYSSIEPIMQFNRFFYAKRPGLLCQSGSCDVEWTGKINIPENGNYVLNFSTALGSSVLIDGIIASNEEGLKLEKGTYSIRVKTVLDKRDDVCMLQWKTPGSGKFVPVESSVLSQ